MEYSSEALGITIKKRREAVRPRLSQVKLGEHAGYEGGPGAGVSISRVEAGKVRPSPERLAGIALSLGLTPAQLEAEAAELTARMASEGSATNDRHDEARPSTARERLAAFQQMMEERQDRVVRAAEAYNEAHERARDEFFMKFVDHALRIDGAPDLPAPRALSDEEADDPNMRAEQRIRFTSSAFSSALGGAGGVAAGAAAGGTMAYGAFLAAASFGTASTGTAIASLSGAAATKAALALLGGGALSAGGAGIAGGVLALAGIVAAPVVALGAGGLFLAHRRSQKRNNELHEKLDEAEREADAAAPGTEALLWFLAEARDLLDYIATHAGHACNRWGNGLPDDGVAWSDLRPDQKARYDEFVKIAGCQLSVTSIDAAAFFLTRTEDSEEAERVLTEMKEGAEGILDEAKRTVTQLV